MAMQVILANGRGARRLDARSVDEAKVQRPLPDDALRVVSSRCRRRRTLRQPSGQGFGTVGRSLATARAGKT